MSTDFPVKLNVHHVGIFVTDMDRSIQWYEEMLGYKLMFRAPFDLPHQGVVEMCWIKHQEHYIELYQYDTDQRPFNMGDYLGSLGTKHLSLWTTDEEFATLVTYLESKKADFMVKHRWPEEQVGKPGGCGVIYIKDPDGIPIEIQEDFRAGEY